MGGQPDDLVTFVFYEVVYGCVLLIIVFQTYIYIQFNGFQVPGRVPLYLIFVSLENLCVQNSDVVSYGHKSILGNSLANT